MSRNGFARLFRIAIPRRSLVLLAVARFVERILLAGSALLFATERRQRALAIALTLAALLALRGAFATRARVIAQRNVFAAAVRALFRESVMRVAAVDGEDAQAAILDGGYYASTMTTEIAPGLIGDGLASIVLAVLLATLLPARLFLLGVTGAAIASVALVITRRMTSRSVLHARQRFARVVDGIVLAVGARLEVVASGQASSAALDYDRTLAAWSAAEIRTGATSALAGRTPVVAASAIVGLYFLLDDTARGALRVVDVGALIATVPAFLGLVRGAHDAGRAWPRTAPLRALLEADAPDVVETETTAGSVGHAPIVWDGVGYAYPSRGTRPGATVDPPARTALADISFTWHPGELLVLTGPNGAGKSTLLRLLLALDRPTHGRILVGDVPLDSIAPDAWRKRIAFLPQRPFFLDRSTVGDAMRFLARDASDDVLRAALTRVGLWDRLAKHSLAQSSGGAPRPLDVPIGALSAGQRQRVALARVLAHDAPIVLLDEPDANLDRDGVHLVVDLVRELARTRMVAVVAHTEELIFAGTRVVRVEPEGAASASRTNVDRTTTDASSARGLIENAGG